MTVPFARQFGPGAKGPDVLAVKRALIKAKAGKGITTTQTFGKDAQKALAAFKKKHRLLADPIYTAQAHVKLEPYIDARGAELIGQEVDRIRRTAFLDTAAWTVAHNHLFDYTMKEPYRSSMLRMRPRSVSTRIGADCSMHAIGTGNWAGLPHRLFHSDGFTGTILDECDHISTGMRAGDLAVYVTPAEPQGEHVTILYKRLPDGDWEVVNHGTQGQPIFDKLSGESAGHPGARIVYCQLPTGG